ncbi:MAG: leucine-rich repeat domain-containing protein [Ruminococcus sp.]|nr:leucine-rich repeat domain-containing protein [Ruminococcus sp.]MDE7225787.1 leucine-rich repeat domain-containing protein [Ruminococcus sp.]
MDFKIENGVLIKCMGNDSEITIPDSVTSIGKYAFCECHNLKSITIPDSVKSIGKYAFSDCKYLTSITIPNSVMSIGDNAFAFCVRLKSVTIPNSVTSIGAKAFKFCERLTSITIPDSVTSIGAEAFCYSSLTSIVISNSTKIIADEAFGYCGSLTSIIINGNELKIDYQEIKNAGELITDAIGMLFKKDFSRKFSHKIKFKLIADYFFCTADDDAGAYLKKNAVRIIRQFIENNDIERISKILEKTNFVTKRNIEKLCIHAMDNDMQEIYNILTDYRNKNF